MKIGCGAHLGDCYWCCQMLSRVQDEEKTIYVKSEHVNALAGLFSSITVLPVEQMPEGTPDGWIANGRFADKGVHWSCQEDIMGFVRQYMNGFAAEAGIAGAFDQPESMLCGQFSMILEDVPVPAFDILAVNCDPTSGQCPGYSSSEFDGLLLQLRSRGHRVLCTNPTSASPWNNFTLREIGNLSIRAKTIIAVASGPMWPTWNIWNRNCDRYIFLDPMRLDFGVEGRVRHAGSAEQMRQQMVEDGLL